MKHAIYSYRITTFNGAAPCYGEETARKYLLHQSYKTYLKRALEIREEQTHG